ncbi:MAG: HEAT repeat domain-containing protein [Candidatus Heimdallarchaeota archaeon]
MPSFNVAKNIELLQDIDPNKRRAAIEALGRNMIRTTVPLLLDLLKEETVIEVRRAIVMSLSLLGGKGTLPMLLEIIETDPDLETRRNAAGGLRFLGGQIKSEEILPLLLREEDEDIRNVLVGTIIYLREEAIVPKLLDFYSKESSKDLQACLLEIIGSFDLPETKDLLIKCLESDIDDKLRLIATLSMGKIDDVSFIPLLYNVYQNDSNEEIRDSAYRTLDELSIALHYHSIDQMVLAYIEKEKKNK